MSKQAIHAASAVLAVNPQVLEGLEMVLSVGRRMSHLQKTEDGGAGEVDKVTSKVVRCILFEAKEMDGNPLFTGRVNDACKLLVDNPQVQHEIRTLMSMSRSLSSTKKNQDTAGPDRIRAFHQTVGTILQEAVRIAGPVDAQPVVAGPSIPVVQAVPVVAGPSIPVVQAVPIQAGDPGPAAGGLMAQAFPVDPMVPLQSGASGGAGWDKAAAPDKNLLKTQVYKAPSDGQPRTERISFGGVEEQKLSETTKKEDRLIARNEAKKGSGEAEQPRKKSKAKAQVADKPADPAPQAAPVAPAKQAAPVAPAPQAARKAAPKAPAPQAAPVAPAKQAARKAAPKAPAPQAAPVAPAPQAAHQAPAPPAAPAAAGVVSIDLTNDDSE